MDFKAVYEQASIAIDELLSRANAKAGDIIVIGCSTSEVVGKMIGTGSNALAAKTIMDAVLPKIQERGLYLAVQCCEHLNRALVVERECAERYGFTEVNVIPQPHAGGAFAVEATGRFKDYTMVESIESKAALGMDIGGTFIGMHLRPVVVPIHTQNRKIGEANLTMARTRKKYVGGERAKYFIE
ncbi:MAG TPA: TIGR01440 family protein [Clostridiales bacterium]|jgi:uncharacterized protein (TIGR01440 family)|nr:TIGR01440 family protein [Clostridiales bacterium]